ncbi:MAG: sulfide:quinone oxidoreductase [Solirubrobacteraceae bacterium]|jgi:sulfide:quinone oxidoreductase|nr:sulfide:quinone oxidoreductase [Solirubrobacteraceae bacterium]
MTVTDHPAQVLIVGGGIAALELLLALRVLAGPHVAVTLLTAEAEFAPRAMTVAEPFERGGAQTYAWSQIAQDQGACLVLDSLVAVEAAERSVLTHGGRRLCYDILAIATGARRVEPFAGALTFGARADAGMDLRALVADALEHDSANVAFALPSPSIWPLPLYELALLTAHELREHGCGATVRMVTPEEHPLGLFGAAARDAVVPMLDALGIGLIVCKQPREVVAGGLRLEDGAIVAADHVVSLAEIVARPVPGLPVDRGGFIPVDLHGRVADQTAVYAAGEVTSFPLRQGGLATQQADAVAEAIAAACGAGNDPRPFAPVLRGRLLTSGAPLYLQSRPSGQSLASARALWSPPGKVAGRYLAPYLATARPPRLGAAPLAERVPAVADAARGERDGVTLARALADAEARCGNATRALQALDAAEALEPDGRSSPMAAAPEAPTLGR